MGGGRPGGRERGAQTQRHRQTDREPGSDKAEDRGTAPELERGSRDGQDRHPGEERGAGVPGQRGTEADDRAREQRQTGGGRASEGGGGRWAAARHGDGMAERKSNPAVPTPACQALVPGQPPPCSWPRPAGAAAPPPRCSAATPAQPPVGPPSPLLPRRLWGGGAAVRCREDRGARSPACLLPARPRLGPRHQVPKVWGRGLCPGLSSPTGRDGSGKDSPADERGHLGSL